MDAIAPVGEMVQPPAPINGIGTLSSLYGLQQQQLGIQQQQQAVAGQTAQTQQLQQKNSELKALSTFTQNAIKDPSYLNPDGSLNTSKFQQDAMAVAPTYGQEYIGQATSNANQSVANRSALLGLTNEQRATGGNILGSLAQDTGLNSSKFQQGVAQMRALSSDPGYQGALDSLLMHAPNTMTMSDTQASQALRNFSHQAALAAGAPNATASTPTYADYYNQGGQLAQRQTNPLAAAPLGEVTGSQVQPGLGPTQTVPYQAAITSAAARAGGMATTDIGRLQQVSSAIAPSAAAIPLTQEIDSLADQIHSGKFAAEISKAAAALGQSSDTYARQILAKDLGQVETRATDFGNPTDKKLGTILSGFPDPTSDNRTIHTAMDYVRGSFRQNVARGQNMLAYQKAHPDAAGFQQSDDQLTSKVDPLTAEYRALKPGTARQGFLQRNFKGADEAQAFASQAGQ